MLRLLQLVVSFVIGLAVWMLLATALGAGVGGLELLLLLVPAIGVGWLVDHRLRRHA